MKKKSLESLQNVESLNSKEVRNLKGGDFEITATITINLSIRVEIEVEIG